MAVLWVPDIGWYSNANTDTYWMQLLYRVFHIIESTFFGFTYFGASNIKSSSNSCTCLFHYFLSIFVKAEVWAISSYFEWILYLKFNNYRPYKEEHRSCFINTISEWNSKFEITVWIPALSCLCRPECRSWCLSINRARESRSLSLIWHCQAKFLAAHYWHFCVFLSQNCCLGFQESLQTTY